ncbi:MAG: hypothetical protein FJ110_05530 [Deltaproteobacteria bacterium]|nr:hypothetical protein [Deltaproteobacteria bacterium]
MPLYVISLKKGQSYGFRPLAGNPSFQKWSEEKKEFPSNEKFAVEAQTQTLRDPKQSKSAPLKKPRATPTKLPPRLKYPKWWKNLSPTGFSLSAAGSKIIVQGNRGFRTFITMIAFTVGGETDITFTFGTRGVSGPMSFGGIDEPRGMVIPFGDAPADCGQGAFKITSTGVGVSVNGLVNFYTEPDEVPS